MYHVKGEFYFIPQSIEGVAEHPKFKGQTCFGRDLRNIYPREGWSRLFLEFVMNAYEAFPDEEDFFTPYFDKLAGTASLRKQIEEGWDQDRIRATWELGISDYLEKRERYMIYRP